MAEQQQLAKLREELARHERICIDSCVFIYHFEEDPKYSGITMPILEALEEGSFEGVASTITVTECLVKPYEARAYSLVRMYRLMFLSWPNLILKEVDFKIACSGASLRGRYGLNMPDALIAATATEMNATMIITNDPDFKILDPMPSALLLDDFTVV